MQLTFLGTGTSMGVPVIGCRCAVCTSPHPHNRRLRTSALLKVAGKQLLIDAGPDLRQQLLAAQVDRLDAVLLTHAHADHVAGLDDLRPLNMAQRSVMPLYGSAQTLADVRARFDYAFSDSSAGSTRPQLELNAVQPGTPFLLDGLEVLPLAIEHGTWAITGFRIGRLGYVTDASAIPLASLDSLYGLDVLVLNALRAAPHPTHFSLEQALGVIAQLQPERALLVHTTHDLEYAATNALLPEHVRLAYDGLTLDITDDPSVNQEVRYKSASRSDNCDNQHV
ncbi:MAG: MBL fold metallo-hydrolase [Roseiflexaceae bacterium]|nr:MBL fold metallo-hydrolase [Roseiflexaceae bacterium]